MYNPIQISDPREKAPTVLDQFSLSPFGESASQFNAEQDDVPSLYTEAVFAGGRKKVEPIVARMEAVKKVLDEETAAQDASLKARKEARDKDKEQPAKQEFDPKKYWSNQIFKELEDEIRTIFGFRSVDIHPFIEKYRSKDKTFETKIMNAGIYHEDRYPIEGLVTDQGFYDKSHSLTVYIQMSLGLIKNLTAEELTAVLLHEFGHGIDPALVNVHYTEANILSKYLTDRKKDLTKAEKKYLEKKFGGITWSIISIIISLLFIVSTLTIGGLWYQIEKMIIGKDRMYEKKLKKVRKAIQDDKTRFNRKDSAEAYADNFARMYGFGPQLISALKKMARGSDRQLNDMIDREHLRQDCIVRITMSLLKDEHKTDIHRIRALLKEYDEDINDPNTPPIVKKHLREDKEELEKMLDAYQNDFSEFQNRTNRIINEELEKIDDKDAEKEARAQKKETPKEEPKKDDGGAAAEVHKESTMEEADDADFFSEVSHRNIVQDHRLAVCVDPDRKNHRLHIIYDISDGMKLHQNNVVDTPDGPMRINAGGKLDQHELTMIRKYGNTDHKSSGQRVLAIIDLDDGKKRLQQARTAGPFGYDASKTFMLKVGEIDHEASFKSTYWSRNDDRNDPEYITPREKVGRVRGVAGQKADDLHDSVMNQRRAATAEKDAKECEETIARLKKELAQVEERAKVFNNVTLTGRRSSDERKKEVLMGILNEDRSKLPVIAKLSKEKFQSTPASELVKMEMDDIEKARQRCEKGIKSNEQWLQNSKKDAEEYKSKVIQDPSKWTNQRKPTRTDRVQPGPAKKPNALTTGSIGPAGNKSKIKAWKDQQRYGDK